MCEVYSVCESHIEVAPSHSPQEPWKRGNMTKQKYGRYSNMEEDEYHVPDNHEEEFLVHILPARAPGSDRDYAGKNSSP